jgi:hypothetical protein
VSGGQGCGQQHPIAAHFDVRDAVGFNAVVEALGWPDIRYVGPAPRTHVHGRAWTPNGGPL